MLQTGALILVDNTLKFSVPYLYPIRFHMKSTFYRHEYMNITDKQHYK